MAERRLEDFVLLAWFEPMFTDDIYDVIRPTTYVDALLDSIEIAHPPPKDDRLKKYGGALVILGDGFFVRTGQYTAVASINVQRLCMAIARGDVNTVRNIVVTLAAEGSHHGATLQDVLSNEMGVIQMFTHEYHCADGEISAKNTETVCGKPLQFALCYENEEILSILYAAGAQPFVDFYTTVADDDFDFEMERIKSFNEDNLPSVCTPLWMEAPPSEGSFLHTALPLHAPGPHERHRDKLYMHREIFKSVGHVVQSEFVKRSWLAYSMDDIPKPTVPLSTDDELIKTPRRFRERARTCMLVLARLHIHLPPNVKTTLLEHLYAMDVFGIVNTQDVHLAATQRDCARRGGGQDVVA
ncbi:hypothetical protein RI054_36g136450 [Pseudoscourfieldia marina]